MSYINIIILVITILIDPYVGLLVSATMNRSFSPIFLYFWYWIPVCAILVFQLTAPAAILGLVIVHFYLEKRKLPFRKSKWIIHACIFGSVLGALAVLMDSFYYWRGFHNGTRGFLLTGTVTGCMTGLLVALLTYKNILLFIQRRESTSPGELESDN
jgi:hypothetical protein